MTTGGVLGTLWPLVWPKRGPNEPRLGVVTGELWLVAGEETGDDSPLTAEPGAGQRRGLMTAGEAGISCSYQIKKDLRIKKSPRDIIKMVHEKEKTTFLLVCWPATRFTAIQSF